MKSRKSKRSYSALTSRLLLRFVISELLLVLFLVGGFFIGYFVCSLFTWQPGDTLYLFLKLLESLSPFIIVVGFFVGTLAILYFTISRPLGYLDDVVEAAKSLTERSGEPIELSPELANVQNELNLALEQSRMNAKLADDAIQRKNDLIMYLAHDLKTPLTSVIGYLTLLRDEKEISPELREKYLSISLEKAERLEDLINEFFEIARFNLSNITLEYSKVSLMRLLEQLTFEFKPMFADKNLTCSLEIAPDTMIRFDVDKMQRVFDNLLRNAVNYSFENSVISIAVKRSGDVLSIKFTNSGNTIPKEKLDRIFEQFYRLDSSLSTRSGGAGLGLAIAKQIVELHHGSISAKSENEIVEFEVIIPAS